MNKNFIDCDDLLKILLFLIGGCLSAGSLQPDQCSTSGHVKLCPMFLRNVYTEYESMILYCEVLPKNADITWWKNDIQLHQDNQHSIKFEPQLGVSSLIINDLKTVDSGKYNCSTTLHNNSVSYGEYIIVNEAIPVTHPRIVDTVPKSLQQTVRLGTSINISCTFDVGSSQSELSIMQWRRNGSMLEDTTKTEYNNYPLGNQMVYTLLVRNISKDDLGNYECYGENGYGNDSRHLKLLEEEFPGDGERLQWTIIAIGCGAGFVVIVLFTSVVIVTCRRKKENIDWEAPDLEHYEVPDHPLEYDVFISYSSEDQHWVKDILFEELTKAGYQVNIDFKDFMPGMAIAENIMDSIYKSRKTVVIMSKNFLKSMWAQFELQQAHNRAIAQRKDVLILIKYGKCKVPAKLLGKTFLDFTDQDIKPHFWKRFYESIGEPGKDLVKVDKEKNENGMGKEGKNSEKEGGEMVEVGGDNHEKGGGKEDSGIVGDAYEELDKIMENKLYEVTKIGDRSTHMVSCPYEDEVSMRHKGTDRNQRLASTESCGSQDSCIGRRISFEERKPLLT